MHRFITRGDFNDSGVMLAGLVVIIAILARLVL